MEKIIKKIVDKIDDLNIVRKGFRILYYVMGVINGLLPAVLLFGMLSWVGIEIPRISTYFNGWPATVFWFMLLLWIGVTIFIFIVTFKYWKKHGDNIVNVKNRYPNITFVADFLHTYIHSYVFVYLSSIAAFAVLAYLFMALTGEFGFYHGGKFLLYLLYVAVVIVVAAMGSLLLIMIVSFVTEALKRKVQMATDLQDTADIIRTSEIITK